jgi:hypothetical protein
MFQLQWGRVRRARAHAVAAITNNDRMHCAFAWVTRVSKADIACAGIERGTLMESNPNLRLVSPNDAAGPLNVICFNYKNKLFRDFDIITKF